MIFTSIYVHVDVQAAGYWGQEEITKRDFNATINRYCTEQVLHFHAWTPIYKCTDITCDVPTATIWDVFMSINACK